jgi:hypothetical protein
MQIYHAIPLVQSPIGLFWRGWLGNERVDEEHEMFDYKDRYRSNDNRFWTPSPTDVTDTLEKVPPPPPRRPWQPL